MAKVTRRGFIYTSGAAAAGLATAGVTGGVISSVLGGSSEVLASTGGQQETLVAYVRPGSNGEVMVMRGNREVTVKDPALVRRMQRAAQ